MKHFVIVIPSLNPDTKLVVVVQSLQELGFLNIVVVDDGSLEETKHYFKILKDNYHCKIITHPRNQGKGAALKSAFREILRNNESSLKGIITVDGDGQHQAQDVLKIANSMKVNPSSFVLGVRTFPKNIKVPMRSRLGNYSTACIISLITGYKYQDTQTGLRGIAYNDLEKLIEIQGERFEYETNVLLNAKKLNLDVVQIPIKTVYLEQNKTSHFKPIIDSVKVLETIIKFMGVSFLSFCVDFLLFSFFIHIIFQSQNTALPIFISTLIARIISAIVNFSLNYKIVFQSNTSKIKALVKYTLLVVVILVASAIGTTCMAKVVSHAVGAKLIVDSLLFGMSYLIQKKVIFKRSPK